MGLIKTHNIIYGVCICTLTVRSSVDHLVIQIVKVMNIGLAKLYRILYEVCVFTVTVRYSAG